MYIHIYILYTYIHIYTHADICTRVYISLGMAQVRAALSWLLNPESALDISQDQKVANSVQG